MTSQISIIIPVYKAENFLHRCVESILRQTYSDFEVLLIDDGSPDSSGAVCDECASQDARIRVYHKDHEGVTAARAYGVKLAEGEWLTFVDADDTLPDRALESLYRKAADSSADITMGAWRKITSTRKRLIPLSIKGTLTSSQYINALLLGKCFSGPVGKLFRRNIFDDRIFDIPQDITNNEDLIMNLRLAENIRSIAAYPELIVYDYHSNAGSASKRIMPIETWDKVFDCIAASAGESHRKEIDSYIAVIFMMNRRKMDYKNSVYYPVLKKDTCLFPKYHIFHFHMKCLERGGFWNKLVISAYKMKNRFVKAGFYLTSRLFYRKANRA